MFSFLLFLTQPFCRSHAGCLSQIFVKESVWTGAGRKLGRAGNPVDYLRPFVTSTSLKYMNISTLSNRLGVEIKYKDLRISQFFSVSLSKSLTHWERKWEPLEPNGWLLSILSLTCRFNTLLLAKGLQVSSFGSSELWTVTYISVTLPSPVHASGFARIRKGL